MSDKLIIFDTTLRDGEQSPGASMTKDEKVRIAKVLEKMKVDVIEAGFAIASVGDFEAVQAVANAVKDSTICSLARALDKDIDRAGEALKGANSARIHTFIATSDIHMKMKLNMTPDQVVEQAVRAVKRARKYTEMKISFVVLSRQRLLLVRLRLISQIQWVITYHISLALP